MGDHDSSPTCLSAEPHGPTADSPGAIRDLTSHYFGCIQISERTDFLDRHKNRRLWDREVYFESERLKQQKLEMSQAERDEVAASKIDERIKGLAVGIEAQYKRTEILRDALARAKCFCCKGANESAHGQVDSPSHEKSSCDLVNLASQSHKRWKESNEYKRGIAIVRDWRQRSNTPVIGCNDAGNGDDGIEDPSTPNDGQQMAPERLKAREIIKKDHKDVKYAFEEDDSAAQYMLERDINGYIIQWKVLRPWKSQMPEKSSTRNSSPIPPLPSSPLTTQSSGAPEPTSPFPPLEPMPPNLQSYEAPSSSFLRSTDANVQFHPDAVDSTPKPRPTGPIRTMTGGYHPQSYYEIGSEPERYLEPFSEKDADYRFKGRFPDQRLTLQNLLDANPIKPEAGDVILNRKRHKNEERVRYFHIPHNNMKWVEEAIARYFNEERPTYDGIYRNPPVKTHSHMVLRPEYWRGQQHGGRRTLVHARHMRAICERISSKIWETEDNPNNLVLFMPFLHWEEDRKRDQMAKIIEQDTERNRAERERKQNEAKMQRVDARTYQAPTGNTRTQGLNLLRCDRQPIRHLNKMDPIHEQSIRKAWRENAFGKPDGKHQHDFVEIADGLVSGGPIEDEQGKDGRKLWHVPKLTCNEHGRILTENKLGQFLLDAARLYEAMSMYRDQQLVEKYLHHDPPLHPRRTLDQSYYWTLKTTKARDRDQVVYRGTMMDERNIHRFRERGDKDCNEKHTWHLTNLLDRKKCVSIEAPDETDSSLGRYKWDGHWEKTDRNGCDHCRGEIRKVSRIVMVDQLWMWILDKQTIITSFPKRYGTNKSDPSGVHKSIRTRIKNARKNQIRSVFDVALIILDECSNTFFDRTKTPDRHPQVIDIFAEAIGSLQNKQTLSFQHLWHWTERASKIYNSKSKYEDTAHLHVPLLNINPEGKLQREVKDIIDELDIMINVNTKQKEVIKRFVKNVENIYDPSGTWRDETLSPDENREYRRSRSMSVACENLQNTPESGSYKSKEADRKRCERKMEEERGKDEFTWFRKQAYDLISDVGDRITELEGLRKSAESTSQSIKDLLDLKQQQASILQAWQSVRQADESVRQGRSVMIFTIVTIIFLPLSFMSSVFGMNNRDIGETNMSFRDQANYMFPISASVILVSIIFAFWTYPRTAFWSAYKYSETWILVTLRIYEIFLWLKESKKDFTTSDGMLKRLETSVEEMKGGVRRKRREALNKKAMEKKTSCQKSGTRLARNSANADGDCSKSLGSSNEGPSASGTNFVWTNVTDEEQGQRP